MTFVFEALFERDGCIVSKSPWGPDDEIGRLNWITDSSRSAVMEQADFSKVYDLSVDYFLSMPTYQAGGDPKFDIWMTHTPRGSKNDSFVAADTDVFERVSYAGDSLSMYTHTGTHIDTLNHFGYFGVFWNGWTDDQLGSRHWLVGGADKFPAIIGRGVLLDVAQLHGVDCLPPNYEITVDDLVACCERQSIDIAPGDIVTIRTGRMTRWPDYSTFVLDSPGIGMAAARFLCEEAGAMCVGGDNDSLEFDPVDAEGTFLPVHPYMLATAGCPIIESLWLEELSRDEIYEFAFIAQPLKIFGSTGSPMRPIAVRLKG